MNEKRNGLAATER